MSANSKNGGTAHCYPLYSSNKIVYNIVGRPEVIQDGQRTTASVTIGNTTLQGAPDYSGVVCCLRRGKHNAMHIADTQTFAITDVAKQAYLAQPNFSNIY